MISSAIVAAVLLLGAQATPPVEAPRPASHARMLDYLSRLRDEAKRTNPFFGAAPLTKARQELQKLPAGEKPKERWHWLREVAFHELRLGRVDASLAAYDEARKLVGAHSRMFTPEEAVATAFDMGVACLRLGEVTNCVAQHCEASCIFPISGGGVHGDKRGSNQAFKLFEWVLQQQPDHAGARWLLNLAAMTLGEYPAKVPEMLRIDLAYFGSDATFPRFEDVAREKGLAAPTLAGGIVADDFDGDGIIDLINSNWGADDQVRFWKGSADGGFVDRTREAGLIGITGGLHLIHADYDNDGDNDVLVLRGAWMRGFGRWPNSLLRNDGKGRFDDVTFEVGLADPMYPTQAAAWADFDGDGDLDLYIGNESSPECTAPSQLLRNDGGKFTDIAKAAGVTNDRYAKGVAWGDIDGDGFPDLYVSNSGTPNRLYRNRGDGTFEDVTEKAGVGAPLTSFSTWFFDYDNDGALDLFVASYFPFLEPYVAWAATGSREFEPQALYKGDGKGGFRNVTREVGLDRPNCTMGSNFGDLDNDGFEDLYLATGFPNYEALVPNLTLWNRRGASFTDVTLQSGMGHLQKGHGVAFFDFDGDGDLDIYEDLGGAFPGDGYASALFANPGFGRAWLAVELTGVQSNRSAIGARIRAEIREGDKTRSIWRQVSAGSSFGGNPFRQHFGLGAAEKVEKLEVHWPRSERPQVFTDVAARRVVRITEGVDKLR
jgi:hypothetical protein